jgi:hypothetical protein
MGSGSMPSVLFHSYLRQYQSYYILIAQIFYPTFFFFNHCIHEEAAKSKNKSDSWSFWRGLAGRSPGKDTLRVLPGPTSVRFKNILDKPPTWQLHCPKLEKAAHEIIWESLKAWFNEIERKNWNADASWECEASVFYNQQQKDVIYHHGCFLFLCLLTDEH